MKFRIGTGLPTGVIKIRKRPQPENGSFTDANVYRVASKTASALIFSQDTVCTEWVRFTSGGHTSTYLRLLSPYSASCIRATVFSSCYPRAPMLTSMLLPQGKSFCKVSGCQTRRYNASAGSADSKRMPSPSKCLCGRSGNTCIQVSCWLGCVA